MNSLAEEIKSGSLGSLQQLAFFLSLSLKNGCGILQRVKAHSHRAIILRLP